MAVGAAQASENVHIALIHRPQPPSPQARPPPPPKTLAMVSSAPPTPSGAVVAHLARMHSQNTLDCTLLHRMKPVSPIVHAHTLPTGLLRTRRYLRCPHPCRRRY